MVLVLIFISSDHDHESLLILLGLADGYIISQRNLFILALVREIGIFLLVGMRHIIQMHLQFLAGEVFSLVPEFSEQTCT